jgi:hypothetical protein
MQQPDDSARQTFRVGVTMAADKIHDYAPA